MAGVSIGDIRSRRISGSVYAIVWGFGHVAVLLLSPPIRLKKEWEDSLQTVDKPKSTVIFHKEKRTSMSNI